jgi:hypothetical protein
MATQGAQIRETYIAGSDLRLKQFFFVTLAADGAIDSSANGAAADGVLLNDPNTGEAATVVVFGRVTVECGTAVTAGALIASDAAGNCVPAASTDIILGKALEAGADGQIITIDFFKGGNAAA